MATPWGHHGAHYKDRLPPCGEEAGSLTTESHGPADGHRLEPEGQGGGIRGPSVCRLLQVAAGMCEQMVQYVHSKLKGYLTHLYYLFLDFHVCVYEIFIGLACKIPTTSNPPKGIVAHLGRTSKVTFDETVRPSFIHPITI